MTTVKQFKDLGVKQDARPFTGDKIKLRRILGQQIVIHRFRIEPSRYTDKGNGSRLKLQIEFENKMHVFFTRSVMLQDAVKQISDEHLPFSTTIIEQDGLIFT